MLRIDAGACSPNCAGTSRRHFIELGVAGMASLGLPELIRAKAAAAEAGNRVRDTRVILIFLGGGPSHMDLWDMKPQAPAEYRGFWRPIATNVPGMQITERFPRQAKVADKFSIIRSLAHNDGDHHGGFHLMTTGRPGASGADPSPKYPSIGSIVAKVTGPRRAGVLPYVFVPKTHADIVDFFRANYLGRHYDPFVIDDDANSKDFQVHNLTLPPGLTIERLEDRRTLLRSLDTLRRDVDSNRQLDTMDHFHRKAHELVTGVEVRRAFDLSREGDKLRDRYGRNNWGQSTLLARRLAEAGVTFTTVYFGDWDQHWNLKETYEKYLPRVDAAIATLFEDLSSRGLLEKVCVVVCGEFSRTPRMNDGLGSGTPGRDHWGRAISVVMGGGGLKGGIVVGATDAKGEEPVERRLHPTDLHATLYHVLGIDSSVHFLNHAGRPVPAIDRGEPIRELL